MAFVVDRKKYYNRNQEFNTQDRSISGTKSTAPYFCDHCKIPGHSVERCFKLYSYPTTSRRPSLKKLIVVTHSTTPDSSLTVKDTSLTKEQFTHLLNLFGKKDTEKSLDVDTSLTTTSNIAGISCLASHLSYSHCIIDIGEPDHMCNDLTSLVNVADVSNPNHTITILDGSVLTFF